MVGINADTTLRSFSAGTALKTVKATEVQCRTETNISEYSEDGGKQQWWLRKTDAEHGGTQKSRARRAGIEPTTIGALASVAAHQATRPPACCLRSLSQINFEWERHKRILIESEHNITRIPIKSGKM